MINFDLILEVAAQRRPAWPSNPPNRGAHSRATRVRPAINMQLPKSRPVPAEYYVRQY